jgi:hypothetical protein
MVKKTQTSSKSSAATAKKARTTTISKKGKKRGSSTTASAADRIINAIASRRAFGETKANRKLIIGLATMTNKKSFDTTILNMKKKNGWVDYDKETVWLTQEGEDYAGSKVLVVPKNNDDMQEKIRMDMIKGGKRSREIFDLMVDGRYYTKADLAEAMGMENNKSFGTYMSTLSQVTEREGGKIRLVDFVFPCGRPCDSK